MRKDLSTSGLSFAKFFTKSLSFFSEDGNESKETKKEVPDMA